MGNNWFTRPENLKDNKPNINGSSFFKVAENLSLSKSDMSSYFTRAGDLDILKQKNSFKFDEKKEKLETPEEIRNWLKTIVSGEKKAAYNFRDSLQITGAGQKFVSIGELQDMIKNGDNIIKAEYFDNMNMVMIEFETFNIPNKSR